MEYIQLFSEGILVFLSPCMLPLLPVLLGYLISQSTKEANTTKERFLKKNLLFFIAGFSIVFVLLGVLASTFGSAVRSQIQYINLIFGIILVLLGLHYSGILQIDLLNKQLKINKTIDKDNKKWHESLIFGIFFALGWTPCAGAFLTSALIKATNSSSRIQGAIMLFIYSMGIAIPLYISGVFLSELKNVFTVIKKNYKLINLIAGLILIITGIMTFANAISKLI